jgi:hypothetical protein
MAIRVGPARFSQFGDRRPSTFVLVTSEDLVDAFEIEEDGWYERAAVVGLARDASLAHVLTAETPGDSDVLVVLPGRFVTSLSADELGSRRLAVLPAGSTPLTMAQVDHFVTTAQRADATQQGKLADEFFGRVEEAAGLRLVDEGGTEAVATFDHLAGDYSWNQQAGVLEPGDQQIAPAGELSVLPIDIMDFDDQARLALTGALTLRGLPIVHRYDVPADERDQQRLFARLRGVTTHPITLDVLDGVIEAVRPVDDAARAAATALDEVLASDERYRVVWELGFGINTDIEPWPGNCGPNEVYGATSGVVHIGLGLTPHTRFALTFGCVGTALTTDTGRHVIGGAESRQPGGARLRRVRSASCGCH